MNNEILECLKKHGILSETQDSYLYDYITNLEQENETLKAKLNIGKTCGFCPYYKYKSRCEKAIELINKRKEEEDNGIGWVEMRTEEYFEECDEVINILNGSDENE